MQFMDDTKKKKKKKKAKEQRSAKEGIRSLGAAPRARCRDDEEPPLIRSWCVYPCASAMLLFIVDENRRRPRVG
uniref:Uncharacterized protein n=1 Tax=Trichogramma kaykai TaxID=54128 RepID=A0ABD2XB89_9HYME